MNSLVLKYVAVLVASAAFFVTGYQYAAALYTKDIEEMRRDYAERSRIMEEEYRAHEQKQTQALVAAWQERDAALARIGVLAGMLGGCASRPPTLAVDCPHPPVVPATLKESSLPAAQTYSKEARSWFEEVSNYLSALR